MDLPGSKTILVLAPHLPAELVRDLLDTFFGSTQTKLEVLLSPEQYTRYGYLTDRKNTLDQVRFVASPARNFFSLRHLIWLRGNLRSSADVLVLLRKSPYEDLTSALVSLLVMLITGRGIILLRPSASKNEPLIGGRRGETTPKWLFKELSLTALGNEYKSLFPTMGEILFFFMFLSLVLKKSVLDKLSPVFRRKDKGEA